MIQKNPIGICFTLTVNIDAVTPVFIETQSNDTAGMVKGGQMKGVAIFAKYFSGLPARKISKKSRDRQCLRLPRSVLVTSFRPNKGSKHRFQMTWRRFVKPAFSLRYASWKHMPYGYRGLKIFTSLSLRFQDFQRMNIN